MTPVYFTDRDLGLAFPAILREAGILVERHADHFEPDAPDEYWLGEVGRRGWVALTRDRRIRYKANERMAALTAGIALFILVGRVPTPDLARNFVNTIDRVVAFLSRHDRPFIARIYRPSPSELARNAAAPGRVELWI